MNRNIIKRERKTGPGRAVRAVVCLFVLLLVMSFSAAGAWAGDFGSNRDAGDTADRARLYSLDFSGSGQNDERDDWDYDWIKFELAQAAEVTFTLTNDWRSSSLSVTDGATDLLGGWIAADTTQVLILSPGLYYVGVAAYPNGIFIRTRYTLSITAVYGTACYLDADGDGYGDPADVIYNASCPAGRVANDDDCDDTDPAKWSGALDICDGIDNDCDGDVDEDCATYYRDTDGDGYGDPDHTASAPADGFVTLSGDCDDTNPAINPGATEVCDGIDNNCDGAVDDVNVWYYLDEDGDGYGDPAGELKPCSLTGYAGYVDNSLDCDDFDATIHPGATETCNNLDDNCDGNVDEGLLVVTYYYDYDGDGWGVTTNTQSACTPPAGYVDADDADGDGTDDFDCNDNNSRIHPGAFDPCDTTIDENCSGDNSDCEESPPGCANLADYPLETRAISANPMVEFLFDDSGSMAWEVMHQGTYNGLFYYQYYNRGVRSASVSDVFNTTSSTARSFYQTQCAEENGLYYNPEFSYVAWPGHTPADPDSPKKSPDSSTTVTMDDNFSSIGISNAHYFVKDGGNVYLVDLDSSGVRYYTVNYETGSYYYGQVNSVSLIGSPPTGVAITRTLAEERQNFANWFQFYRTRQNTAKASILQVVDSLSGVKIGVHTINGNNSITIANTGMLSVDDNKATILGYIEDVGAYSGTPLRLGLKAVGNFFAGDYSGVASPYSSVANGGECQQAFAIVMTDGYYNGSNPGIGNADADDAANDFDGPPFADSYSDTLADVAMYFYKNDLRDDLADAVPTNEYDYATHQHLVTYGVCFGLVGTIDPADYPNCPSGGTAACPDPWPNPGTNEGPERIDNLYHAAVNGRGKFISASNPLQLVEAIRAIMDDVVARRGSGASVAVSTQSLKEDTLLFQGSYDSAGWKGDLRAYSISMMTGLINPNHVWSAAAGLDALTDTQAKARNIFTYNGSAGVAFSYDNLSADQKNTLGETEAEQRLVVDFIKGDRSQEQNNGGPFRTRRSRMGDIVHSAPVHVGDTIYVGGNDGMLYAINALTGAEQFAYIPEYMYPYSHLYKLADPNYVHKFYVDNTAFVRNGLLVCGLGRGGKGYFALDVSNPSGFTASDVLWEYPAVTYDGTDSDPDMGYTFSRPAVVPCGAYGDVLIFGNGYSSTNQEAVLYVIDINDTDGSFLDSDVTKIPTGVGGTGVCNGLSTPTLIDTDQDGDLDIAYAGDLQGNLWKFDLSGTKDTWAVACKDSSGNPKPLFQAKDESGKVQPITTKPAVTKHCAGLGYMVTFGTGQFMAEDDFADMSIQALYGIWDWENAWAAADDELSADQLDRMHYGYLQAPSSGVRLFSEIEASGMFASPNPEVSLTLVKQTQVSLSSSERVASENDVNWFSPDKWVAQREAGETPYSGGQHVGWYLEFPSGSGERIISDPQIRSSESGNLLIFMSLVPSIEVCRAGGYSIFNVLDACTGKWEKGVVLDDIYYKPPIIDPPEPPPPLDDDDDNDDGYTGDPDSSLVPYDPGNPPETIEGEKKGMVFWRFIM